LVAAYYVEDMLKICESIVVDIDMGLAWTILCVKGERRTSLHWNKKPCQERWSFDED
jgi:hypothetical protein